MNNLSTITFNNGLNPIIMNGKPLKSINQFYNKKLAFLKSELELKQKRKKSKEIIKLTNKRNNKIIDYLHKSSRKLVNQLVSNDISTLIIGKNTSMKQDINLGKKTNQNFVQLPIFKYLNMIEYKSKLEGIKVIYQEESYTSKCSFLDQESIKKHLSYKGKRLKRGLFESEKGKLINTDVNGSLNIMIKAIPNIFLDGIEGVGVHPFKLNI
jgi:putative transposase